VRRREFIAGFAGAAAWPLAARAQQGVMPAIGFFAPSSPDLAAHLVRAFRQGLYETGYFEGRNVAIDYRWAEDQDDRLSSGFNEDHREPLESLDANQLPQF
jgi:putative tryptophan/tyrosine transport system substrate-binding protein